MAANRIFPMLKADDPPCRPMRRRRSGSSWRRRLGCAGDRREILTRGGQVYLRHALPSSLVLLASSLPRGYAAPCLCEILSVSRDLQQHPYDRLMGVLQLLVNISTPAAFTPQGRAVVTAQKLRLLHAGVRTLVPRFRPGYEERHGLPVNHEDMLATIMGFSFLVIDGLRRLRLALTAEEEEDFYYLWRIYSQLMGIHPDGHPEDASLIPGSVAEAEEFYNAYVRRQDTAAAANPYGVVLTTDNVGMMVSLLPRRLRWLGFGAAPRVAMAELMTPEELARVGVSPTAGHALTKGLLSLVLHLVQGFQDVAPFSSRLATLMFQGMIDLDRGGQVTSRSPSPGLDCAGRLCGRGPAHAGFDRAVTSTAPVPAAARRRWKTTT